MMSVLTFLGGLLLTSVGFILGRFFSESERILSDKRRQYLDFLSVLPPLNDVYLDVDDGAFLEKLRPAIARVPSVLFYCDPAVAQAIAVLLQRYEEAHSVLGPESPPLAPEYMVLAKAQNDLVLEMRRDAFRWSIFNYSSASRLPEQKPPSIK